MCCFVIYRSHGFRGRRAVWRRRRAGVVLLAEKYLEEEEKLE
jgi:hypothetical protein